MQMTVKFTKLLSLLTFGMQYQNTSNAGMLTINQYKIGLVMFVPKQ